MINNAWDMTGIFLGNVFDMPGMCLDLSETFLGHTLGIYHNPGISYFSGIAFYFKHGFLLLFLHNSHGTKEIPDCGNLVRPD